MSNMVDQVIAEYKEEESTQGESQTQDGQQPSEDGTEGAPKTQTPGSSAPDASQQQPTASTPRTAKDYSSFSKEEKAQFAFGRQLAKQKAKHDAEIADLKNSWKKEFDELKASLKPKEEPKKRMDFETDDEYIRYLNREGLNEVLAEQKAQEAKEAEERAQKDAEAQRQQSVAEETARTFNANVSEYFKGRDAELEVFSNKVNLASQNGLGELLDNAPSVKDFVFTMPDGVAVLNEMLNDRNVFIRVMQASVNPMVCTVEMMRIAQEARQRGFKAPQQQQMDLQNPQQPQGMPHIGKPGARQGSGVGRRLDSDADIIDFIRGR